MQKYFINENIELNKSFKIESSDQHHIEKVMRNKNGDQIICVDLKHIQYLCSIENVQEGTILPIEKLDINNELDVEGEIADVFIYILSMCRVMNVNLIEAFKNKEERNCKREWKYLEEK